MSQSAKKAVSTYRQHLLLAAIDHPFPFTLNNTPRMVSHLLCRVQDTYISRMDPSYRSPNPIGNSQPQMRYPRCLTSYRRLQPSLPSLRISNLIFSHLTTGLSCGIYETRSSPTVRVWVKAGGPQATMRRGGTIRRAMEHSSEEALSAWIIQW